MHTGEKLLDSQGLSRARGELIVMTYVLCYFNWFALFNLLSIGASLCETCFTSGRLAEHDVAISTQDNRLRMAKNSSNLKATRTLDVHKE
jgi:hypothetical protein